MVLRRLWCRLVSYAVQSCGESRCGIGTSPLLNKGGGGDEATDTQLPYDPRVTGHRSQLEPVLNVALSSPLGAIECFIGWFSPLPRLFGPDIRIFIRAGEGGRGGGVK